MSIRGRNTLTKKCSRRGFLKGAAISAAGAVLAACAPGSAAPGASTSEDDTVTVAVDTQSLIVASFYPVDQTAGWDGLVAQYEEDNPALPLKHRSHPLMNICPSY